MLKADIIIPVLDAYGLFRKCITSLRATTPTDLYKLIIADDGSSETALLNFEDQLEREGVVVLRNKTRLGFNLNCNQAAGAGTSPVIVFLNSDTEPLQGWLESLLEEFATHSDVGVVGARLLYPTARYGHAANTIQHAGVARNAQGLPYHIFAGYPANAPEVTRRLELNAVTGACLATRRDVFEKLGGFAQEYRWGQFEDIDYCWEVRRMGLKVVYQPRSVLYHYEHGSGEKYVARSAQVNRDKLVQKWGNQGSDEHLFRLVEPLRVDIKPFRPPAPVDVALWHLQEVERLFGEFLTVSWEEEDTFRAALACARAILSGGTREDKHGSEAMDEACRAEGRCVAASVGNQKGTEDSRKTPEDQEDRLHPPEETEKPG